MYGAVYGDLIGSLYEYREFLNHDVKRMIKASEESELLKPECFISDDTILTVAVKDALINGQPYDTTLKRYILDNSDPLNKEDYFKYMFSPSTMMCAKENMNGNSAGNGAIMRISSIPYLSKTPIFMYNEIIKATSPTHNCGAAMRAVFCVSNMIYLAKQGVDKKKIKSIIDANYDYKYDFNLDKLREDMIFNTTCMDTMPIVLFVIFNTDSFDDAMRTTLSLGGDTDTNCAIVGSIAEALYGIDEKLKNRVDEYLPKTYQKILRTDDKLI